MTPSTPVFSSRPPWSRWDGCTRSGSSLSSPRSTASRKRRASWRLVVMDSVMAAAWRELCAAATGTTLELDPRMRATVAPRVLVERDAELARMAGRLGAACRGEGGVLVIEGEAGGGENQPPRGPRERAGGGGA